ncbi:hypothetical protein FB45DRAFT_964746 [Roridomyces roridus]|uniref:SWIM-type domain-containing protein n=1 Tax=Roridomyces roridus TaxID=1738132 RepID=A0AAD7AXP6_9AGAR|nr:hypothetical protein FB45DRAFT_964746 [Roridomyces roridus]
MFTQEIFLLERNRVEGELKEVFKVVGSTGNIYTVTVQSKSSCDCPDAKKCPNVCKHILFIYVKVLQVPLSSNLWYQKGFFKSELETIFAIAPLNTPNAALPEPRILKAYAIATGKIAHPSSSEAMDCTGNCHLPGEGDDCPICFERMHGIGTNKLVFCEACGRAVHKECFKEWKKHKPQSALKCLYCMKRWPAPKPGYLNISDAIESVGTA